MSGIPLADPVAGMAVSALIIKVSVLLQSETAQNQKG